MSINTMTLGGLAIAIGELVDDAIVDVENIYRRLREWRLSKAGTDKETEQKWGLRDAAQVVFKASCEVRNSIVFATIIVILVFIPLFSMGGIEGRIFIPLGIAYVISLLASLLISLTLTPVLSFYLLPKAKFMGREREGFVVRGLKWIDRHLVLRNTLKRPILTMLIAVAVLGFVLISASRLGTEFLPPFNEGSVTINVLLPPGTSLAESDRVGMLAERLLAEVPEVKQTGRRVGRAEQDEHAEGVHSTEIEVELETPEATDLVSTINRPFRRKSQHTGPEPRGRETVLNDIRSKLSIIPGAVINIGQPISHRIDHLLSGIRAQIAVKLFGSDLVVLRQKAEEIRGVMSEVPGVVDLFVEKLVLVPQTRVEIDRAKVQKYGLRVGEVAKILETALQGEIVSEVLEGQRRFDLVVRLPDSARESSEALKNILIDTPGGQLIPLRTVAHVYQSKGPNQIMRENVQRRIVVQSNVSGRDLGSVITDIQAGIEEHVSLPEGYFIGYGGQFESQKQATRLIGILSFFSLAGMFIVLYTHFRSANIVCQILLGIPFGMIGAVAGIWITGGVASVASLVAFITLCGITARNGILMIDHYLHLMRHEGHKFDREMIVKGSLERLVPVLMTAATTTLALIPLILAAGEPGKEILYPVAVVVFGGMFTSTLLDIVIRPAVFWRFGQKTTESLFKAECPEELARIFPEKYGKAEAK